jgi:hypothetical protein
MKDLKMIQEGTILMPGHSVEFTYEHHLNSKSVTMITKVGVLIRAVRDKRFQRPTGFFMVQFKGNKSLSKVHESRLINLTMTPQTQIK